MPPVLVHQSTQKNIPIFHFQVATRTAVDQYVDMVLPLLEQHIESYQETVPFCYILDISESGMFPINYAMIKITPAVKGLPYHPQHYIAYITTDHSDSMLVSIVNSLTAQNLQHTRKIYSPDDLADAVDWLADILTTAIEDKAD